ncbi:hypothetical protein ACFL2X_01150 [Candidatus Latescibacterota bacterium]
MKTLDLVFLYLGAALPALWGIAHLFPTQSVVRGFGEIGTDNTRIITMEWIIEGVALIFIGVLTASVTAIGPSGAVTGAVYSITAGCLIVLAIVSVFTGFRIHFLPFRLCPFIFGTSAALILFGGVF